MKAQIKATRETTENDPFDETKFDIVPDETAMGNDYDDAIESMFNNNKTTTESKPQATQPQTRLIKYDVMINRVNNYVFPEITFDDVDSYDFNKHGFIEVLKSPSHVHLYFDFDSMYTFEEKEQERKTRIKA